MDLKTVKLNCLTLGELENLPISKKSGVFLLIAILSKSHYNRIKRVHVNALNLIKIYRHVNSLIAVLPLRPKCACARET